MSGLWRSFSAGHSANGPSWRRSQPTESEIVTAAADRLSAPMSPQTQTEAQAQSPALGKAHTRRLREMFRSAGWPCQDPLEIELLAAGMLERVRNGHGHESLRVTEAGVHLLAQALARNRAAMSAHETLVERVAQEMGRAGRIAWRGLSMRAQVPRDEPGNALRWCIARPDVFSIRNTSVEEYAAPVAGL